ncbi:MAG: hypothetical protein K2P45_00570 [Eubacterium sp.]|nr:hypothetical protein [Eubacterium sp.]
MLLNLYTNGAAEAVFLAQGGGRYLALPQWVFLAAVCIALYDLLKHGTWSVAGILMGVLVCTCGLHFPIDLQNTFGFVPEGRDDTRRACRTVCLKVCKLHHKNSL